MEFVKYNSKSDSSNNASTSNGVVGGILGVVGGTTGDGHTHANLQVLESITAEQWAKITQLLNVISVGNNGELLINGDVVSGGEITAYGQTTQKRGDI